MLYFWRPLRPQCSSQRVRLPPKSLTSNTTIMLEDGVYDLGTYGHSLWISGVENVAIRGASGNRDAVILKGSGMSNSSGSATCIMQISNVQGILIADMTLTDVYYHLIQIHGESNTNQVHLYNLRLTDAGEQFVKISTSFSPPLSEDGIIEYCTFEFTKPARTWYTGGVDGLYCRNWVIRNCTFRNIYSSYGLTCGAILMWRNCYDITVEGNEFINCDFAVRFGADSGQAVNGGLIANNFVYRDSNLAGNADAAFTIWASQNIKVYNNTIVLKDGFPWSVGFRYSTSTGCTAAYNLTNRPIINRDGATATFVGNITNAGGHPEWFVDFANGDLHLVEGAQPINLAAELPEVLDDYDFDPRPIGSAPDVGADEFRFAGDANADGSVNVLDLMILVDAFGSSEGDENYDPRADLNKDGSVNVLDLLILVDDWGKSL